MPAFKTLAADMYCHVKFWNVESEMPPHAKFGPVQNVPVCRLPAATADDDNNYPSSVMGKSYTYHIHVYNRPAMLTEERVFLASATRTSL